MMSAYNVLFMNSNKASFSMKENTMNFDQTGPKGSSLIWVHIACNIGYQST